MRDETISGCTESDCSQDQREEKNKAFCPRKRERAIECKESKEQRNINNLEKFSQRHQKTSEECVERDS